MSRMLYMMRRGIFVAAVAGVGGGLSGFFLASGMPLHAALAIAVVFAASFMVNRAVKSEEVEVDERAYVISEKASRLAMMIVLPSLGLFVFTLTILRELYPEAFTPKFNGVLGGLGAAVFLLLAAYLAAYTYYSRKPIIGR